MSLTARKAFFILLLIQKCCPILIKLPLFPTSNIFSSSRYSQACACCSFWSSSLVFKGSSQQWPTAFITVHRKPTGYTVLMLAGNASDGRYARWVCEISNMNPQPSGSLARLSWNVPLTVKSSGCQLEVHRSHELSGAFMLLLIGLKHFNLIQLSSWHFNHCAFSLFVTWSEIIPPSVPRPTAWSLSRDVGCRGTWSHPLQRLQHPLPFVERPGPQERKGQAGVPETVLWGGLARHRERERSCWSDVYIQSLQEGQNYAPENQF